MRSAIKPLGCKRARSNGEDFQIVSDNASLLPAQVPAGKADSIGRHDNLL